MGWKRLSTVLLVIAILCLIWAGFMGWLLIEWPDSPSAPDKWWALAFSISGASLAFASAWVADGFAKDAA